MDIAPKPRIDAWCAPLSEAQRWDVYYRTKRGRWTEVCAWIEKEFDINPPSRTALYDFAKRMRVSESSHRIEQAVIARQEAGELAASAGQNDLDLIEAYKAMGADLALSLNDAAGATAFTKLALDLAAQLTKTKEIQIKERDQNLREREVAIKEATSKELAIDLLIKEAGKDEKAKVLLKQFVEAAQGGMRKNRVSIREKLSAAVADQPAPVSVPEIFSFSEFLLTQAQVKVGARYLPYRMDGRPALELITGWVDEILASGRADCRIKAKGGAQWGKTVWALNLYGYLLGNEMLGTGYYLPDVELVEGIVDTKFLPDVVDQIPWFASLLTIGKTINKSGKQVNRKGAIMATDGDRTSLGYFLGCNRVPTTYTHDVQIVDERDDINEKNEKYLDGRLTSSKLRLRIDIGTARYDKAGMDKEFEDSTQHCAYITCVACGDISPEDEWPGVCRLQMGSAPSPTDPRLTLAGDFKADEAGATVATHRPENIYYLGCPHCGHVLDRNSVFYKAKRPEMATLGKYGVEVSQISTPAIGLIQIVAAWASAVADPDKMTAFRCDRWARPKSSTQGLDTGIMDRDRRDYALSIVPTGRPRFGGVDTGDRFWFVAREIESAADKSFAWAEQISPTVAQSRIPQLFDACGLTCLFIDIGNERQIARNIVMIINGILDAPPVRPEAEKGRIDYGRGISWDGTTGLWRGIKAAAVEFSGKPGSGITHEFRRTQEDRGYPVIRANRDECIQRVVDEFLTADDGLQSVVDGKIRTALIMYMPSNKPGCNAAVSVLQQHFISGSRKAPGKDGKSLSFIDKVENHYLLANAYSALAETTVEAGYRNTTWTFPPRVFSMANDPNNQEVC